MGLGHSSEAITGQHCWVKDIHQQQHAIVNWVPSVLASSWSKSRQPMKTIKSQTSIADSELGQIGKPLWASTNATF
jgi:hypothetical protein